MIKHIEISNLCVTWIIEMERNNGDRKVHVRLELSSRTCVLDFLTFGMSSLKQPTTS